MADKNIWTNRKYIAIDIGTSNTRIYIDGIGVVYNEPSIMAIDNKSKKVIAIGKDAKVYVGKLSGSLTLFRPMKNGVISDMNQLNKFLEVILAKFDKEFKGSIVTLACPISATDLEKKALTKAITNLGAYFVSVQDDIKLALLGSNHDINRPEGVLVLDIGAGKATAAVITTGEAVSHRWNKVAGDYIDNELLKFVKSEYKINLGEQSTEKLKMDIAVAVKPKKPITAKAYGYDMTAGKPAELEMSDKEGFKVVQPAFGNIANLVTGVLEDTPTELAGDVIKNGLIITGGSANIPGTKFFFEDFFEIKTKIPKNSSSAVFDGAIAYKSYIEDELKLVDELSNRDY